MRFEDALLVILSFEGGYVNDPNDPGGETKYGISKKAYPNVDIANLTIADAGEIYRHEYWDKVHADDLSENLRLPVFDCAVNQGVKAAIRFLQMAVGTTNDGIMGSATIARSAAVSEEVVSTFLAYRAIHYAGLDTFSRYGKGWLKRLFSIAGSNTR